MLKHEIVFLIVIAERKKKQDFIDFLHENEGKLFNVIYGHGSVKRNDILKTLGLVVEQNKVIITCLMKKENANKAIEILNAKFNKPNTGIAFTIPVEEIKY